jgi:hypothetical protein
MHKSPQKQVLGLLKQAKEILLVGPTHLNSDVAAGLLALHTVLNKSGKTSIAVAPCLIPRQLQFLPNSDAISQTLGTGNDFVISIPTKSGAIKNVHATEHDGVVDLVLQTEGTIDPSELSFRHHLERFDAIVVIGADELDDCGKLFTDHSKLFTETPIINIAVSPANEFFGRVNFVDSSASAVCELLTDLITADPDFEKHLDADLSTTLLAGILSATDSFLASNTSARSLELAAELQSRGANQSDVIESLFKQKSFANLRVLGRLLGNLQLDPTHRMAWTNLTASDFELTETTFDDLDGWSDQLIRHVNGADIVVSFVEQEGNALIQIRTANELPLDSLANLFEGNTENVLHGFNLLVKEKSVPEIQSHALRIIADWQEQRLHIEKIDIRKITIEELKLPIKESDALEIKKTEPMPHSPKNIPFEIPIQEK